MRPHTVSGVVRGATSGARALALRWTTAPPSLRVSRLLCVAAADKPPLPPGRTAILGALRACGKRGRWRVALDSIAALEETSAEATALGEATVPYNAWQGALLACRKHLKTAEMFGLVARMDPGMVDTVVVNELLHVARHQEDYQVALPIWRAMRGESLGVGEAGWGEGGASVWGGGAGAGGGDEGEAEAGYDEEDGFGDEDEEAANDLKARRTAAALKSFADRKELLATVISAAEVVARAAALRPEAVRPDALSYQHMLTMCGFVARYSVAISILNEMHIPPAEPTHARQPTAKSSHVFAAMRACNRDRRWREAADLGESRLSSPPPSPPPST